MGLWAGIATIFVVIVVAPIVLDMIARRIGG